MRCTSDMIFGSEAKMQIQEILDLISFGEYVCLAANKAKSFKMECDEVGERVNLLVKMLKSLYCFITSARTAVYMRPINCIAAEVKDDLKLAMEIVCKCKHQNMLYKVLFNRRNVTKFHNLLNLLDVSISNMRRIFNIYVTPIEAIYSTMYKKSAKFFIWACIAAIQMGSQLEDRVMAAEFLEWLAREKDEYKNIIYEEGGVPPLQKLLERNSPLGAQIMAANVLCLLANEEDRAKIIMKEMISTILNRLSRTSPIRDQIQAANVVASIAIHSPKVKEYDLIRENVIWRLVSLLSSEQSTDDQLKLKISCSKALWMLAIGSLSICRTLTETSGMLCIAKLMETEHEELHFNCLMVLQEITAIAGSKEEFRHAAFKRTSPAAMAVVDELLKVIKEHDEAKLRIPAIRSIGSLARSFSAKESRVISPLVARLENTDQDIAMAAAIALQKFVCDDNHICSEHSKSIIKFNGVPLLMKLLRTGDEMVPQHGLALICYLAKHDSNSNVLIKAGALTALETTGRLVASGDPNLEELVSEAISKLQSNHTGEHEEIDSPSKGSIKQIISTEPDNVVSDSPRHLLKLLTERPTLNLPKLENLQVDRKTSEIVKRCRKGLLNALRTRRIQPLLKSESLELVRSMIDHLGAKTSAMVTGGKNRILLALRSFTTRRIQPFLKLESLELALQSMIEYPGARSVVKEIARQLKLVKKIVNPFKKKENRRNFGYIIHKFLKNCNLYLLLL